MKCHACATCYWLADAKEVGVVTRDPPWKGPVPEEWEKAPEVREPSRRGLWELGDFTAARQALREVSTDLAWVADRIRRYCAAKDTRVHKLDTGRPGRSRR